MTYPIEGACQCGQITYRMTKAPNIVVACHCTECQKLSGSPFSVTAVIDSDGIEFSGELNEWSRSSDSGNINSAKFCPGCGNRIYHFDPADLSTIRLKLKPINMEEDSVFEPTVHVWVSKKLSWYQIPEGMQVLDKQG